MSAIKGLEMLAQRFDADRRHLRSVAFQLLGSVADADDAVQSAWLQASRSDLGAVENLTGRFTTITAHQAFEQLRVRKRRAERPLVDPDELARRTAGVSALADDEALLRDSVSSALLVVGADNRIHRIGITGDADRLSRAVLTLPRSPSQECHSPIRYQRNQTPPAGRPAARQGEGNAQ
jgi:DNA-directed RNA polymerase specialized sigma24 family protein